MGHLGNECWGGEGEESAKIWNNFKGLLRKDTESK